MKPVISIILFVFVLSFPVSGQELSWSSPQKIRYAVDNPVILGKQGDHFFISRTDNSRKPSVYFEKYLSSLKQTGEKQINYEKGISIEKVFLQSGNIYVFYSKVNSENNRYLLLADIISLEFIETQKGLPVYSVEKEEEPFIRIYPGPSNSGFDILIKPEKDKEDQNYEFLRVGEDLRIKDQVTFLPPVDELEKLLSVHSSGKKVAMIFEEQKKKRHRGGQSLHLVTLKITGSEIKGYELFTDTLRNKNISMDYDRINDQFIAVGFYNTVDSALAKGILGFKVSGSLDSIVTYRIPFPKKFLIELQGMNRKNYGLEDFRIRNLVVRSDGGVILIAENVREIREVYSDYSLYGINQTFTRLVYYYLDIVVFSISPEGQLDYYKIIRKDQVSSNDGGFYSSFSDAVQRNRITFIYNDLTRKFWNLLYYGLRPGGETEKKILVNGKDSDVKLIPARAKQVSPNEVLIPGYYSGDKFILLKVQLK